MRQLPAHWIAALALAIPVVAVHASYAINLAQSSITACNPYIDGCVSISAAARSGSGLLLFRALMLPYVTVLLALWWIAGHWLQEVSDARARPRLVVWLGVIAAVFLALYVTMLGELGDTARWMRRYGINIFFGFTVLAQMFCAAVIWRAPRRIAGRRAMVGLCAVMLVLGIASIPLQNLVGDRRAMLNNIEWIYALLMVGFFGLLAHAWRRDAVVVGVTAQR